MNNKDTLLKMINKYEAVNEETKENLKHLKQDVENLKIVSDRKYETFKSYIVLLINELSKNEIVSGFEEIKYIKKIDNERVKYDDGLYESVDFKNIEEIIKIEEDIIKEPKEKEEEQKKLEELGIEEISSSDINSILNGEDGGKLKELLIKAISSTNKEPQEDSDNEDEEWEFKEVSFTD